MLIDRYRDTEALAGEATDAAKDWVEARLVDAGRVGQTLTDEDYDDLTDEAMDWWARLSEAERAQAELEGFYYLDTFYCEADKYLDDLSERRRTLGGRVDRRCTLKPRYVETIRLAYARGDISMRSLARSFHISVSNVCEILNGHYWKPEK